MRVLLVPVADRPECARALNTAFDLGARLEASVSGCHIRPHRNSDVSLGSEFAANMVFVRGSSGDSTPYLLVAGVLMAALSLPLAGPLALTEHDLPRILIMGALVVPVGFYLVMLGPNYIPAGEVGLLARA